MTQRKPSHAEQDGLPGLSKINDIVSTYFSIWNRQVQVLNEVFADCTRADATAAEMPKAWSKLLHTWTDDAQDLCDVVMGHGTGDAYGGSQVVTFVIDRSAETAGPQTVRVPAGVDATNVVASSLVSLTDDGDPGNARIVLLPLNDDLEIRVAIQKPPAPARGTYLSVVCEPKAGTPADPLTNSPNPPPRTVVATVLVVFL